MTGPGVHGEALQVTGRGGGRVQPSGHQPSQTACPAVLHVARSAFFSPYYSRLSAHLPFFFALGLQLLWAQLPHQVASGGPQRSSLVADWTEFVLSSQSQSQRALSVLLLNRCSLICSQTPSLAPAAPLSSLLTNVTSSWSSRLTTWSGPPFLHTPLPTCNWTLESHWMPFYHILTIHQHLEASLACSE